MNIEGKVALITGGAHRVGICSLKTSIGPFAQTGS